MTTLSDLRILDLSTGFAGAYCSHVFASYGADVIMIEPLSGGPVRTDAHSWSVLGSGKQSISLDVTNASGRSIFRKLVEGANVVIETFPPGRMDSLGLGFADLHGIKRRIILTSITGAADSADHIAGLNAFAATAIAAHNADAYEVPQHIEIDSAECLSSAFAAGPFESAAPGQALFEMSEVASSPGQPPALGEHTVPILCAELGFAPNDLPILRANGAI